ncbi:iron-siderophore ABC transporter substrate-binding protein [Microbacterium sp. YMB-B2]|uniref:Iron-siderophore ABC transporter substrate-binding protein n=1 Tax=Microbacterium tenebrionis TaxID=2830665 RepID=A0A9X1RYK3_9MICO|nr:iron-siderophore ABC transporter substrate-binding protein [Microbacterium tenebrionis]MCC2028646.1 iron-siderophore ABC transporter substrate-binding protein [Microbacterium tenebrionis]
MPTSRLLALGAAAVLALSLAACSSTAPTSTDDTAAGSNPASDDAFPVTIEHVYGETTITEKPERVATVAWANHEVPLALGIVPVGMSKVAWGDDDDNGVLPWVEEKLDELGAETPVLFDEADGIDFEAVADTNPDVILASYSGLTQEDYDTLSKIAPTIAYPEVAWGTSYQDMITMNATALGLADEGAELVADLESQTQDALDAHPALKDAKVLFTYIDPNDFSQVGFYTPIDTRPGFLLDLGLPEPQILKDNADATDFYLTVSAEEVDKFDDVDLFITYGDESMVAALQADPLLGKIPAVAQGQIAILPDATPIANSANPSPLSIPWGIDEYFSILEAPLTGK